MSEMIVYVDRSDIRQGRLDAVRAGIIELVGFVEEQEPQLLGYGFYLDETKRQMTVVAVHPDSESLITHMEVGTPLFREFADSIELRSIDVYGVPSDEVIERLEQKARMLGESAPVRVHEREASFVRGAPAATDG